MEEKQIHVLMVPWLAFGHINPFLELARKLDSHGIKLSFVSTPLNITRIKQQILPPGIDLVELPLPSVEGLPNGVESTADLKRGGTLKLLVQAMDGWEKPFEALLQRLSPDFVIHDMMQHYASGIAAKLGIPTIFFVTTSAAFAGFIIGQEAAALGKSITVQDLTVSPPGFPSSLIRYQLFEAQKLIFVHQKEEGNISAAERWRLCMEGSWVTVFNTCVELEGAYMECLERITGRPMVAVGILMPSLPPRPHADSCLTWLDSQSPRSVVFVAFGSESILTGQDLAALAVGLEESDVPFLCVVLRHMAAELPHGFVTSMHGKGVVVTDWAPQLHILSHPSTGAFLTHCGWNSTTDGLRFGVPLIALPIQHDQGITAKLVAGDLKVGVEVRRNEEDGCFYKEDICRAVRAVMVEDRGTNIRSNVERIRRMMTDNDGQVNETNIKSFVSLLREKAFNKSSV